MRPASPLPAPGSPARPAGAVVRVWDAGGLGGPRPARGADLRPVLGERVPDGGRLVLGRRESGNHPRRESDAGVVRLALDQDERPWTSRRHVELDLTGDPFLVRVLPAARRPAKIRLWGTLTWDDEPPGAQRPLPSGRPLALLLPGAPSYLVSVEYVGADAGRSAPEGEGPHAGPPGDDGVAPDRFVTPVGGETEPGTAGDEDRAIALSRSEIEALARIFKSALQWPPAPCDDTTPPWTSLPNDEALRAAYRRIERGALEALGLPKGRGPNPALLARLITSGYLTYEQVSRVAEACDLPLHPRRLV